jgi:hypothetical protein
VLLGGTMTGESANRYTTGPAWTTCLGIIAVLFGTLYTAVQGNELLLQAVIAPGTAAVQNVPIECRKDEAEQEGVSVAECELMVANVRIMIESRPGWFRGVQMGLALTGALVAFGSIFVGVALVDVRRWAPGLAVATFATLLVLDGAGLAAALYTGPLLRAIYLPSILLWISIHLCLTVGAAVGRQAGPAPLAANTVTA